jgi:hypothetical protein
MQRQKNGPKYYRCQTQSFLQNGKDTCAFSSLASGFHYFNDKMASDTLLQNLDISLLSPDPIQTAPLFLTGNTLKYDAKQVTNIYNK